MNWVIYNKETIHKYVEYIDSHKFSGIWHSPSWLEFQLRSEKAEDGFFFGIEKNGKIQLAGLLLIYRTSLKFDYAYIPGGILYDKIKDELYDFFLLKLNEIARSRKLAFSQLDSNTFFSEDYLSVLRKKRSHKLGGKLPIPSYTNMIDLKGSEDEILEQMKPKGRYNIKLSIKKGVTIKRGNKNDIPTLYQLLRKTAKRDGFNLNSEKYYHNMLECIPDAEVLIAYFDDTLLAGGIFTYTKKQGLFYYGASDNIMRNLMAPYQLQWKAIQIAKEKNCEYFDFMGISAPGKKNDALASVTDFKLKFGGEQVHFNPSYFIIHNWINYLLFRLGKKIRKHL